MEQLKNNYGVIFVKKMGVFLDLHVSCRNYHIFVCLYFVLRVFE